MVYGVLSVVCFCCVIFLSHTTELAAQRFEGGLNTGVTATEVSGDKAGGPDKLGWYAGAFVNYPTGLHSRLQLEIMYIQKGSRVFKDPVVENLRHLQAGDLAVLARLRDMPPDNDYRDYRLQLHYLEVPVLFQLDLVSVISLPYANRLTTEIGLSASRIVGHYEEEMGKDITSITAELKPFRKAELNVLIGLYYPIGDSFSFHLRFSQGVTPFRPHLGGAKTWYNKGQYNTAWSFGLSWYLLTDNRLLISR